MSYVIDASALLAAAERDHPEWAVALERARRLGPLMAPALIASEAGNVLHVKRPHEFGPTAHERTQLLELLLATVDLVATTEAHRRAAGGATDVLGLSFYDAEYLALAAERDLPLVTQDAALRKAAQRHLGRDRGLDLTGLQRALHS